jgi:hypothetical protein
MNLTENTEIKKIIESLKTGMIDYIGSTGFCVNNRQGLREKTELQF